MSKIKLIFILIFAAALSGCQSIDSHNYVMSVDDEKISTDEFNVYLTEQVKNFEKQGGADIWEVDFDGVPAKQVAKQNATNTLIMVKAAVKHADQLGVSLNDEEKLNAHKQSEEFNNISTDVELLNKIMEESAIQIKVYDKITGSYQINNDEFENYLYSYYTQNKEQYTKYTVKEIFIQSSDTRYSYDEIKRKFSELKSSADFDKFALEVSPNNPIQPQALDESLYSRDVLNQLAKGGVGSIIMAEDTTGYHIFEITNITQTPIDSIRQEVKDKYIGEKKQEIYKTQNDNWTSSMKIERNSAVFDSIEVKTN